MKTILSSLLALTSMTAYSAEPRFVRIQPDQSSYTVGSKAVIFAHIDRGPIEATKEFFITVNLSGEAVNMIPLSEKIAVALPARFQEPGVLAVESNVYLQDKARQAQLLSAIALHQREIDSLLRDLEKEKDPEARAMLEARINAKRSRIEALNAQMERARSLVEVNVSRIMVTPETRKRTNSVFSLSADRDPAIYQVGEIAHFTAHLNSEFEGPDGPKEHILRGKIDGVALPRPVLQGENYTFSSPAFSGGDLGVKTFTADLSVRSKAQADLLRSANALARKQRSSLDGLLQNAIDPGERAYLESKIFEMNRVIGAIMEQLDEVLLPVDSMSLEFSVE